jgi:hypothetical protein
MTCKLLFESDVFHLVGKSIGFLINGEPFKYKGRKAIIQIVDCFKASPFLTSFFLKKKNE